MKSINKWCGPAHIIMNAKAPSKVNDNRRKKKYMLNDSLGAKNTK